MTREEALNILHNSSVYHPMYFDALNMAIEALEKESCADVISRNKAIVQLSHLLSDWNDDWNVAIRKCIETIKIAQPYHTRQKGA